MMKLRSAQPKAGFQLKYRQSIYLGLKAQKGARQGACTTGHRVLHIPIGGLPDVSSTRPKANVGLHWMAAHPETICTLVNNLCEPR